MFIGLLHLHSSLRYVVLFLLVLAMLKAIIGLLARKPFTGADNKIGTALLGATHLQVVIGLILYFVSPTVEVAMSDMGAAMKDATLRFWAVEHITMMLIAAVLITVGRVTSKKALDDLKKHKRAAIFYSFAFAVIMYAIPWAERGFYVSMGN